MSYKRQELLTLQEHLSTPKFSGAPEYTPVSGAPEYTPVFRSTWVYPSFREHLSTPKFSGAPKYTPVSGAPEYTPVFGITWVHPSVQEHLSIPQFSGAPEYTPVYGGVRVVHLFIFLCCVVFFCFVCLRPVSCVPNVTSVFGLFILACPFGFL